MTDVVVNTLRLRGTHGRRLARVAARALPAALDRALADVGDLEVASVQVVLDLDPEQYDDETLAVLWADLVRAELVARRATSTAAVTPDVGAEAAAPTTRGAQMDLVAVARGWLSLPTEARRSVPAALLSLGDPEVAVHVAARLGAAEWRRLVVALRLVLPTRPAGVSTSDRVDGVQEPPGQDVLPAETHLLDVSDRSPAEHADPTPEPSEPMPLSTARELVAEAADVVGVLETFRELQAGSLTPLDPDTTTRAAGLALLYPWLADHCHAAEVLHPGLDHYDVREAALAALLGDRTMVDDLLVRMLSGRPAPWDLPPREHMELPHQDEIDSSAERVLASFASLLPGFERSTPEFVRSMWLLRLGVIDTARYPALLIAATHPLDVLIPLLPYPIGLFKLPWSPALTVKFRP